MKIRAKTIKQIGFIIGGTAFVNFWGGGSGSVEMDTNFLPNELMSKNNMLRCVNDGGFGVESIYGAEIYVSVKYDNGSTEMAHFFETESKIHSELFLGWNELEEQKEEYYIK